MRHLLLRVPLQKLHAPFTIWCTALFLYTQCANCTPPSLWQRSWFRLDLALSGARHHDASDAGVLPYVIDMIDSMLTKRFFFPRASSAIVVVPYSALMHCRRVAIKKTRVIHRLLLFFCSHEIKLPVSYSTFMSWVNFGADTIEAARRELVGSTWIKTNKAV